MIIINYIFRAGRRFETGVFALLVIFILCLSCERRKVIFSDGFGKESEGAIVDNIIQLPPPAGLGYTWRVLEKGALPVHWKMFDVVAENDPTKGFWVIPPDSGYLEQGGRSGNSILFADIEIPRGKSEVEISFRQYRSDNDYIGYLLAEDTEGGKILFETGYMTQVPGTDSTTMDAYITGWPGDYIVKGSGLTHQWARHRFVFRNDSAYWYANDVLMISGSVPSDSIYGYFGIRQRYERGTRYDDFLITVLD